MPVINFIIITILVIWVIRLLLRLILPMFLRNLFGKMQNQASQQGYNPNYQQSSGQRKSKPEGTISIDYIPKKDKKGNADKLGDFVDFEETK